MTLDESRHSIASTTDYQAETGPSPSRRGVLRTAATGILGVAGVVGATDAASATRSTPQRMDTGPSTDRLPTFDRYVAVFGDGDEPGNYEINTDGALLVGIATDIDAPHTPDVIDAARVIMDTPLVVEDAQVKGRVRPGRADNYLLNAEYTIETGAGVVYRELPLR